MNHSIQSFGLLTLFFMRIFPMSIKLFSDGGSRGYHGRFGGSGGALLEMNFQNFHVLPTKCSSDEFPNVTSNTLFKGSFWFGRRISSHQSEYLSLVEGLYALRHVYGLSSNQQYLDIMFDHIFIFGDNEIILRKLSERCDYTSPELIYYHRVCRSLLDSLPFPYTIQHIPRKYNQAADALANVGLFRTTTTVSYPQLPLLLNDYKQIPEMKYVTQTLNGYLILAKVHICINTIFGDDNPMQYQLTIKHEDMKFEIPLHLSSTVSSSGGEDLYFPFDCVTKFSNDTPRKVYVHLFDTFSQSVLMNETILLQAPNKKGHLSWTRCMVNKFMQETVLVTNTAKSTVREGGRQSVAVDLCYIPISDCVCDAKEAAPSPLLLALMANQDMNTVEELLRSLGRRGLLGPLLAPPMPLLQAALRAGNFAAVRVLLETSTVRWDAEPLDCSAEYLSRLLFDAVAGGSLPALRLLVENLVTQPVDPLQSKIIKHRKFISRPSYKSGNLPKKGSSLFSQLIDKKNIDGMDLREFAARTNRSDMQRTIQRAYDKSIQ